MQINNTTTSLKLSANESKLRVVGGSVIKGDKGDQGLPGPEGKQGIPGPQGMPGKDGKDGRNGVDGKDGKGIKGITLIDTKDRVKTYRIEFTDGGVFDFQVKDGEDGKDGKAGVSGGAILKGGEKVSRKTSNYDTQSTETYPNSKALYDAIHSIKTIKFVVVDELPDFGQSNIVYLKLSSEEGEGDKYEEWVYVYNEAEEEYQWEKLGTEVDLLPDQTGQSGKYLMTNGTDASWETLNALQNESSSTTSLNLMPVSGGPSVNYGDNVLIRSKLTNINNRYSVGINTPFGGVAYGSIGIGANNANGGSSVAVGFGAQAGMNNSVSLGAYSHADGFNSIAIGYNAQINSSTSSSAIQIGYYNNVTQDANCLYVGFASVMKNYKLLDGTTGKIPDGRLPIATSVSSSSTNADVIGAKLFYDTLGNVESLLHNINSGS